MKDRIPRDLERDLHAYVDGQLADDPERRQSVEERVAADETAAAEVHAYRAQNEALRAAYDGRISEPVPDRLKSAVSLSARGLARAKRVAAIVAAFVAASGAGWMAGHFGGGSPDTWSAERFMENTLEHYAHDPSPALGVANMGPEATMNWLSERLSLTFRAPDLRPEGYVIAGSSTVTVGGERVVRLRYSDAAGGKEAFSIFFRPRWDAVDSGVRVLQQGGISMAAWLEGPLAATIAGRMPRDRINKLASAVRQAMRDPGVRPPTLEPGLPKQRDAVLSNGIPVSRPDAVRPLLPAGVGGPADTDVISTN